MKMEEMCKKWEGDTIMPYPNWDPALFFHSKEWVLGRMIKRNRLSLSPEVTYILKDSYDVMKIYNWQGVIALNMVNLSIFLFKLPAEVALPLVGVTLGALARYPWKNYQLWKEAKTHVINKLLQYHAFKLNQGHIPPSLNIKGFSFQNEASHYEGPCQYEVIDENGTMVGRIPYLARINAETGEREIVFLTFQSKKRGKKWLRTLSALFKKLHALGYRLSMAAPEQNYFISPLYLEKRKITPSRLPQAILENHFHGRWEERYSLPVEVEGKYYGFLQGLLDRKDLERAIPPTLQHLQERGISVRINKKRIAEGLYPLRVKTWQR